MKWKLPNLVILAAAVFTAWGRTAEAASTQDQLVHLSKLSMTALQCTYLATDATDSARLLQLGVDSGRRYVELALREKQAFHRVRGDIPGIFLQLDGPSADFVVGRAQGMARARLDIDEIEALRTGSAAPGAFRPAEYKRRNCAGLNLK